MAASKLKNRRRFITRDVRLDIPEDQEFTISPVDVTTTSQHNSRLFAPYSITDDNSSFCDRTWPRRTWRPANDFVKTFGGLHQNNSVVNSTLTLPRYHHGANNNYESQSRPGLQPQTPGDWNGNENTSPSSPSDARWRFRSLSDVVSSSCLSAASSPSETVSEPCFKTNCHDNSSVVYDVGSLSSRNSNVSSPRDLAATTFALRSIPELGDNDDNDDDISISGLEAKRRSRSLNETSFYRPFFNQLRSNRSPQPGSVLHRALTWEMAGKSRPFQVTVSPISDPKSQESGFHRNASGGGKLLVVQPHHALDPNNVRSSGSAWKSVDPTTMSWTKQREGTMVSSSSAWNTADSESISRMKKGEGTTVSSSSVWKSVDPTTKSWSKQGEQGATISSSSAWKSVEPAIMSWAERGDGTTASASSAWKRVDPAIMSWAERGDGTTVGASSAWKRVDPVTKSWTTHEEKMATFDQDRAANRLSPSSISLKNSWDEPRIEQTTWNPVNAGKQSEETREMISKNLSNGCFDLGRLEQNATGGDYDGFRAKEFGCSSARLSPVKASRSFSGSAQRGKENVNIFDAPPNNFRNSHTDDLDSSDNFLRTPLTQKTFKDELYRDDINYVKTYADDFLEESTSTGRKPFRSKSLKLLSSEANSFTLGKDSGFLRPLSDWKSDTLSLSTPNSPLSPPTEVEASPKPSVMNPLAQSCQSMMALNTEPAELGLRTNSLTRSATNLPTGSAAPQKSLSTWGPFVVKDLRKAIMRPVATASINRQIKPDSIIKPFGSNFVVRRITNLAKNPFNSISAIGEDHENDVIKPSSLFRTTTKTLSDETSAFIKSLKATQLVKETNANQNPLRLPLELEKPKQDPIEMTLAYNDHDISARDKTHVPWSGVTAWIGTHNTKLDESCSPSNYDSLTSSKDTGHERSATESSPTVTSERLTIHLAEPRSPSLVDEHRLTERSNSSSTLMPGNSTNRTNGEPCSRHIRVFLKSSSQLQDEATASHVDRDAEKSSVGNSNIDVKWKKEVSKIQLDKSQSGDNRWIEVGDETYAKEKDSIVVKDSAKVKESAKLKGSAKETDSAKVNDSAKVKDSAKVIDSVTVKYSSKMQDLAIVKDSAKVNDSLIVKCSSKVKDSTIMKDSARVKDSAIVQDLAIAKYLSKVKDSAIVQDLAIVKDSAKVNDSVIVKYSSKLTDSACLAAAEPSPKATHPQYWHPKSNSNENPTLLGNVGNRFEEDLQRRQNEVQPPLIDLDSRTFSTTVRPAATSSKCHVEMRRSSDTGLLMKRKPFEIVKKKLIIPESMSWFGSIDTKSKPSLKQEMTSEKEKDLLTRKDRDDHGFRSDEKLPGGVKVLNTVAKETNASRMNALVADAVEYKSNRSAEGGSIPYTKNDPCPTDVMKSCDRPVHILENITLVQSNHAVTFDTGISISDSITLDNDDNTNNNVGADTLGDVSEVGLEKSTNVFHDDVIYKEADDVLCFLNGWTDATEGGKKYETTATNFLSNGKVPLVNSSSAPQVSSSSILDEEEEQAKEFQANMDCSIMTELDHAIEMLTATRTLQNKTSPTGSHVSTAGTTIGPTVSQDSSLTPWEGISRKLTQAFSAEQVNRKIPPCDKVPPVQDKGRVSVSTVFNYFDPKPAVSFNSFQGSCQPIAPIKVIRLTQKDVEEGKETAATDKRNQWMMFQAREDSFNRPDSPLFRKTLPLPKDSVIMRHRLKEMGSSGGGGGGGGTGSLSSSESSDEESPAVPRVAPRRAKKLRSMSVDRGVVGIEISRAVVDEEEEDENRNGERDSIASSTTSLRPVSLDSSFLSEDNM